MEAEKSIPFELWKSYGFPTHPVPDEVVTHVNKEYWKSETERLQVTPGCEQAAEIMRVVLEQLTFGTDSKVASPGNQITFTQNYFSEPVVDIPRIADSLASEIKAKHMAGPLKMIDYTEVKVNGLMAVPKPSGDRRQVGNLSSPSGRSFNDGIPEAALLEWPVFQTSARAFSDMVARAGWGCIMSKSDMVAAYKTLPVCTSQRSLQNFCFLGALFVDLRMIFGDRLACMYFDRLHYCIIHFMVLQRVPIPARAVGRAVDDVPSVVPAGAGHLATLFTEEYRRQLSLLNIQAAKVDPLCIKAFEGKKKGEVLGITFDTNTMCWSLPAQKTASLLKLLDKAAFSETNISLHDIDVLHGRLVHFSQLARPVLLFADEVIQFLKALLTEYKNSTFKEREKVSAKVPKNMSYDCRILYTIVSDAFKNPLPILKPLTPPPIDSIPIFPDASGDWEANASVGIFVPHHGQYPPLVASLRIPFFFLAKKDSLGHSTTHKSTTLECLSFLAALCLEPWRWQGMELDFHVDNLAATLALPRGRSRKDPWATTLIRAARGVAAALGATIHCEWTPRRSSRGSLLADELSHCRTACLTPKELAAFLSGGHIRFPDPILSWMRNPQQDEYLGFSCWSWIRKQYPFIN